MLSIACCALTHHRARLCPARMGGQHADRIAKALWSDENKPMIELCSAQLPPLELSPCTHSSHFRSSRPAYEHRTMIFPDTQRDCREERKGGSVQLVREWANLLRTLPTGVLTVGGRPTRSHAISMNNKTSRWRHRVNDARNRKTINHKLNLSTRLMAQIRLGPRPHPAMTSTRRPAHHISVAFDVREKGGWW